jgi:hypothetical protein
MVGESKVNFEMEFQIKIYMLMKQSLILFSTKGILIFFLIISGRLGFIIYYLLGDEATNIS